MSRRTSPPESSQSIPEMVDDLARQEVATWYKDGKLTPYGGQMTKMLDRALPPEKVDEWGFLLSRKEREAIRREAEEKKCLAAGTREILHLPILPFVQRATHCDPAWIPTGTRAAKLGGELSLLHRDFAFAQLDKCGIKSMIKPMKETAS